MITIPSRGILAVLLVLGMAVLSTSVLTLLESGDAIRAGLSGSKTESAAPEQAGSAPH